MSESRLDILQKMLAEDPDDSFLVYAVAKELQSLGMVREAVGQLADLKRKDPEYIGLYYHLGKMYETLDETLYAIKTYKDGIEVAKKLKDFHALSELNNALLEIELGY